jgi:hypothetical protein
MVRVRQHPHPAVHPHAMVREVLHLVSLSVQVSRIDLNLVATHPDCCAGLAFLGESAYAFGSILFAQGAMLAGLVASRILYRGESLLSFKVQIVAFVVFFVLAILGPLLMFTPRLAEAKKKRIGRLRVARSTLR